MTLRQLIGLSPLIAGAAVLLTLPHLPYLWGHELSEGCQWSHRASVGFLGPSEPDGDAKRAEYACWHRHGLQAPDWQSVKTIMRKFPTQAQLVAWNGEPNAH